MFVPGICTCQLNDKTINRPETSVCVSWYVQQCTTVPPCRHEQQRNCIVSERIVPPCCVVPGLAASPVSGILHSRQSCVSWHLFLSVSATAARRPSWTKQLWTAIDSKTGQTRQTARWRLRCHHIATTTNVQCDSTNHPSWSEHASQLTLPYSAYRANPASRLE